MWRVVGSNRLWDAISNGAIPVFTDPRQYDIVPFKALWRSISLLVPTNDSSPTSEVAKGLLSLSKDARARWSELMDALATGRPIVSWIEAGSVTLRAYVQLLVDHINAMFCGPCIRTKQRKKKCRQPRCERTKCAWSVISTSKGCIHNADGTVKGAFQKVRVNTTRDCQIACEEDDECIAVDFSIKKRKCSLFRKACSKPLKSNLLSLRLEVWDNNTTDLDLN